MGRVRIAIPPKVPVGTVRMALARFGEIKKAREENCSLAYNYPVSNGIRIATVTLDISRHTS